MKLELNHPTFFQEKLIPPETSLVGMSALVHALNVDAPVRIPTSISNKRIKEGTRKAGEWRIFDSKYTVDGDVQSNLVFALKHEHIDLLVLKRIFLALPENEIASYVNAAPTGPLVRRIWFLFEFLTGKILNVPDSGKVANVDLLDGDKYFVSSGIVSPRHRVKNNLLGSADFCPIIRHTATLDSCISNQLSARAQSILDTASQALVARAASFLLLADTQASFAIEGERLPINKNERWLRAVQQVGKTPLSLNEMNRLHGILMGDYRFTKAGLREDGVFLGTRTPENEPLPEFIGAKPEDLKNLMEALIAANTMMTEFKLDAVLQAAAIAFGFVYIHPYEDGNGRLHRCLIHHILAEKKFSPRGLVFPVSSVMFKWIDQYRTILQQHSSPLMNFIEWVPTNRANVQVKNDTADLYRYFDCTASAEFLYACVKETIEKDVPNELDYLNRHDTALRQITNIVEMPDRMAEDLIMFMRQNQWQLPKKRRQNEFKKLTDSEIVELEKIVRHTFVDTESE